MGYTSKKNFSPLTDEIGLVIDGCGNTYEDKHYYNGTYIDLCGLSVEDYMTNPCCGGSGSGGGSEPDKIQNTITVIARQDEASGYIYYQAFAVYPVTSKLKISVQSTSGVITELDIYVGEVESKPEIGDTLEINEVFSNIIADDNYEYVVLKEGDAMKYDIYIGVILKNELYNLRENNVKEFNMVSMEMNNSIDANFVIPATDVNYNNMGDDEFNAFCEENQHAFVFVVPQNIYADNAYSITNYGGDDVKDKFGKEGNISINEKQYIVLAEYGKDDIMPFVPLYNEEHMFTYKFSLNK